MQNAIEKLENNYKKVSHISRAHWSDVVAYLISFIIVGWEGTSNFISIA